MPPAAAPCRRSTGNEARRPARSVPRGAARSALTPESPRAPEARCAARRASRPSPQPSIRRSSSDRRSENHAKRKMARRRRAPAAQGGRRPRPPSLSGPGRRDGRGAPWQRRGAERASAHGSRCGDRRSLIPLALASPWPRRECCLSRHPWQRAGATSRRRRGCRGGASGRRGDRSPRRRRRGSPVGPSCHRRIRTPSW